MKSNLVRNLTWLDLRSCQKQKKEEEKNQERFRPTHTSCFVRLKDALVQMGLKLTIESLYVCPF